MSKTRISVPSELADILAKVAKLIEQGQSVTLVPSDSGVDIFHAYSNQLVLFAPEPISAEKAKQQKFGMGDRVARARETEYWLQYSVKRVESKERVVACPIDKKGQVDWTTELLFQPQELVMVQSFQDYLLHGIDITTISEEWKAIESAKTLQRSLEDEMGKVKKKLQSLGAKQ